VRLEGLGKLKEVQLPDRVSNQQSSGLQYNASTNYATACRPPEAIDMKSIIFWNLWPGTEVNFINDSEERIDSIAKSKPISPVCIPS
jgi:hypothetical protein